MDPDGPKPSSPRRWSRTRPAFQSRAGPRRRERGGQDQFDLFRQFGLGPSQLALADPVAHPLGPKRLQESGQRVFEPLRHLGEIGAELIQGLAGQGFGLRGGGRIRQGAIESMGRLGGLVPLVLSTGPPGPLQVREVPRQHRTHRSSTSRADGYCPARCRWRRTHRRRAARPGGSGHPTRSRGPSAGARPRHHAAGYRPRRAGRGPRRRRVGGCSPPRPAGRPPRRASSSPLRHPVRRTGGDAGRRASCRRVRSSTTSSPSMLCWTSMSRNLTVSGSKRSSSLAWAIAWARSRLVFPEAAEERLDGRLELGLDLLGRRERLRLPPSLQERA